MHAEFVLVAPENAICWRQLSQRNQLVHYSERGSQHVSIRYSNWISQASIELSVGSAGDIYDNALAETINSLYNADWIRRKCPIKAEAGLEWVSCFNNQRLLTSLGYIPPTEAPANYYLNLRQNLAQTESLKPNDLL